MTVASTNISLDGSINNEWGDAAGATNVSLTEFYRSPGGSIVDDTEFTTGVPSSGEISFSQLAGKQSNSTVTTGTLTGTTFVSEEEIGAGGASVTVTANTIATVTFSSTQIKVDIQCIGNISGGTGGGTINETNGGASFNALTVNRSSNNTFARWKLVAQTGTTTSQTGNASASFGGDIANDTWATTSGNTAIAYSTSSATSQGDAGDARATAVFRLYYDYDSSGSGLEVTADITIDAETTANWSIA